MFIHSKLPMTKYIMEFNEPLNLSIKKRPVAVVTPSSSNKTTTQTATTTVQQLIVPPAMTLSATNHLLHSHTSSLSSPTNDCASLMPNVVSGDMLGDCEREQLYETQIDGLDDNHTDTLTANKDATAGVDANITNTNNQLHSPLTTASIDISSNLSLIDLIYGRSKTPSTAATSAAMAGASVATITTTTAAVSAEPITAHSPQLPKYIASSDATKTLSIAEAAATLTAYLNQQQSLDIAKLHLERYLKVTNQYLQSTLDGGNMTANEQINQLIRTNILTNKIAANNLISIINKLLEQNIISEYYFKHASRLLIPDYRDHMSTDLGDIKDTDGSELFDNKFKLSPQRISGNNSDKQNGDKEYGTDDDTNHTNIEPYDFEEKIKKETIPIHSNPFMSYLHMQLHRGYEQTLATTHSNSALGDVSALHSLLDTKKMKSHQRIDHVNSNSISNLNNNTTKSSTTAHQMAYDLSLNINNLRFII